MTPLPIIERVQQQQTIRSVFQGDVTGAKPMELYSQAGLIDFLPTSIVIIYTWHNAQWSAEKTIVRGPRLRGRPHPKSAHKDVEMYFPDWRLHEAPSWVVQATVDWRPEPPQL